MKIKCGRCNGAGTACRGCSGFAVDHPELFGGCGVMVKCPDCTGTGKVELDWVKSKSAYFKRRFYHDQLDVLGTNRKELEIQELEEMKDSMPKKEYERCLKYIKDN